MECKEGLELQDSDMVKALRGLVPDFPDNVWACLARPFPDAPNFRILLMALHSEEELVRSGDADGVLDDDGDSDNVDFKRLQGGDGGGGAGPRRRILTNSGGQRWPRRR